MNQIPRLVPRLATLKIAAALWLATVATGHTMTWYFGNDPPADKKAAITSAMNEAVADYNANGYFDVNVRVIYDAGIPTAQSDFNGQVGFGGSISARVAHHEISHYLGTGTTNEWYGQFDGGGAWTGAAVRRYMNLFDGPGSLLRQSGQHYYPYGLNYDNEDSPQNRLRETKLVSAMRFDMGNYDANGNGIDDEWERWKTAGTLLPGAGTADSDGDGISNYDEWWTEGDPMRAVAIKEGHIYIIRARHSQKVVDVVGNSLANGANVDQYTSNGTPGQKWMANYRGGGYWRFINVNSGKVLETANVSSAPSANIQQYDWLNNDGQQWRLVSTTALYSKIFNKAAMNMTMDVENGSTADAANISQYYDLLNDSAQEFAFDDVTPGELLGGLKAEYKFDNTVRDNGGGNFNGVVSGVVSYAAGRVDGMAATFNGTTGSVEVPASVETDFTLACWVRTTATAGGAQWYNGMGLVDAEVPGVKADFGLALVGAKIGFGVGNPDFTLLSASAVNDGNWHHVAATRNNTTGALQIFIDGVLNASANGIVGARSAPNTLHLGSIGGTTGFYAGSLDEVRLYNTILSPADISRLANVGNSLVANYKFENNVRDSSSQGNHGNPVGITYVPGQVGASAAQFNGTSNFVQIPASVVGDFSVAYWVKTTATGGTGQWYAGLSMVDADVPGVANDWGIALVGNKAGFGVGDTGAGLTILSTTAINNGAWHHIAATRTNASGAMRLYVDGVLQANGTGSTALRDGPGGIRVGSTLYGGSYFSGAIDDLRVYNYPLTAAQVAALSAPLPTGWTAADVGNPGSDGYTGYSATNNGTYTVVGGGTDIGGTSDQFQFVSAPASGDQTVITRLTSPPLNAAGSPVLHSLAGLMFRNSTDANAAFVDLVYDHLSGLRFMYRDLTSASAGQVGSTVPASGQLWLKLTRVGNTFSAFYATTNATPTAANWIPLGTHSTALTASPLAGLAVTSHIPTQVATASFTNLTSFAATPGNSWRQDYFGTSANAGVAADSADPDFDGINNLLERALGLNPTVSNSAADQPQAVRDETYHRLYYTRNFSATDLQFQVMWSSDLATWSAAGVMDTVISTGATTEMHEAKVPLSTVDPARNFLRLQVSP